jgi:glutathione S-transferase
MSIADLAILPQLRKFERGLLDHIPTNVLDAYPIVNAWKNRMENNPAIFAHYFSADAAERTARERRVMSAHTHGAEEKAADTLAGDPAGSAQSV